MTPKEIKDILGVSQATLSDWSKKSHSKNQLYKLLMATTKSQAKKLIDKYDLNEGSSMLLLTVNSSIGDKSKHLSDRELKEIILKESPTTPIEKYALKVIKTEALPQEISEFAKKFRIPKKKMLETIN